MKNIPELNSECLIADVQVASDDLPPDEKSNAAKREQKRHNWRFQELGKNSERPRERFSPSKKKRGKKEGQALSLSLSFFYITINQYPIFIYEIPKQVNI